MAVNQKRTGRASSLSAGLVFGACISLGLTILGAILLAKLLDQGQLQWENVGYGIMVLLLMSSYFGAMCAYMRVKSKRLMVCLLSGVIYVGVLLSITALFFGGQYEAVGVTTALVLAGSGSAGLLGLYEKRGGNHKKRRGYSC